MIISLNIKLVNGMYFEEHWKCEMELNDKKPWKIFIALFRKPWVLRMIIYMSSMSQGQIEVLTGNDMSMMTFTK